jgi:hypothetical protein
VNPDHLFLGTAKDNAQDALRKGRLAHHRQTRRVAGHKRTPDNTVTYQRQRSTATLCRTCSRRRVAHFVAPTTKTERSFDW